MKINNYAEGGTEKNAKMSNRALNIDLTELQAIFLSLFCIYLHEIRIFSVLCPGKSCESCSLCSSSADKIYDRHETSTLGLFKLFFMTFKNVKACNFVNFEKLHRQSSI